ncbi:MAG: ATP-binding protein, partial [Flavobacteriaceae bacterium]|nr:ATP-binding protein [Flavobacteriaceae bacterium]
ETIEDKSIDKTYELLDTAYAEVRKLAGVNNSGVFAKIGLIPSLQQLVNNVSTPDLKFELTHYGLNQRIDNSVEIAVFRIIQELISNILKHAEASVAQVSLTQNKNHLNIFVEDNGKGFDPKTVHPKSGFGLEGIKKRVQLLNGDMVIESKIGHGTSLIIDIIL